jgi:hypothetical protein
MKERRFEAKAIGEEGFFGHSIRCISDVTVVVQV